MSVLKGVQLQFRDGSTVDGEKYLQDKVVALFFSACWCAPCLVFTPKLKQFYDVIKASHPEFEVVFISRDKDQETQLNYHEEYMPDWPMIPFGDDVIAKLLTRYEVRTIPIVRVVKPDGHLLVQDARNAIQEKGLENAEELYQEWLMLMGQL